VRGRPIPYSAAERAFVQSNRAMRRRDLHTAFVREFGRTDVTIEDIKGLCKRSGWTNGRQVPWTKSDDAVLRELYANTPAQEIARRLGRTLQSTYAHAKTLGLEKSAEFLASPASGRIRRGDSGSPATQFKKGETSPNKGKPRPAHWAIGRMRDTQFKRDTSSWRTAPIGGERFADGYSWTKVADQMRVPWTKNWLQTHILRWERVNGPVPKGHVLKCLDGNRGNNDPSNWVAIPKGVLPRLHGKSGRDYDRAPAELKPTILAIARLEHAVKAAREA
jgi:hypothetical protein